VKLNSPEISVYITNHNYGNYLNLSIKSVLNQTFKDFELIILDDGSTDNSIKILSKFKNNKKIRIIYQKNEGMIKSINTAIKASKGRFVLRLDADDYLNKNALLVLYNEIVKNKGVGLVYSDYYLVDKKNSILKLEKVLDYFGSKKKINFPAHGACSLIRKNFLEEVNFYDQRFKRQDGVDLWYKFINRYKINKVNLPLFYYRQHSTNLSKNKIRIYETKNKILKKFSKKNKKKVALVIPVLGKLFNNECMSLEKFNNSNLILICINEILKLKILDKIIISSPDENLINYLKKKYKKKIFYHQRKKQGSFENTNYNSQIKDSINKIYKNKSPDILVVVNFEYPFRRYFYIETLVNTLNLHSCERVISVKKNDNYNFYQFKNNKFKLINNDNRNNLKLEKKEIFQEDGGLVAYNYKNFKSNVLENYEYETNYILMDKKSSFYIQNKIDLEIAEKIIFKTRY